MLGVGVTLSTLPLFLTRLGCSPNQLAIVISVFSGCQMLGCPLLVGLSARVGRLTVLRACLGGNALASILTACASNYWMIACARALAGLTAASVPVAQVAVADMMPPGPETSKALTRVASAASLGIICGPAVGGLVAEVARSLLGITSDVMQSRAVFGASGLFATIVLLLTSRVTLGAPNQPAQPAEGVRGAEAAGVSRYAAPSAAVDAATAFSGGGLPGWVPQALCRWQAAVCTTGAVVGIATYALFSLRFLGYGQRALSLTQSGAAAVALSVNLLLLPRLIDRYGEAAVCSVGLGLLGVCLSTSSLVLVQPYHAILFLLSRAGLASAETTSAALTVRFSAAERRGRNLALLQSTQSGSRIFSPLIASWLYTASLGGSGQVPPGTLPFIVCGACALLTAPAPMLLQACASRASGSGARAR